MSRRWVAPTALVGSTAAFVIVVAFGGGVPQELRSLLIVMGCCGYLVMGVAERKWGGLTLRLVGAAALVQFAVAIAVPPRASTDLWWYDIYGRILAVHHASPYTHVAADFPHDPLLKMVGNLWQHTPSVYGPLFTAISAAAATVLGTSLLTTRLFYQGLALAAVSGAAVIIWRRTRSPGAVAFLTAQPVVALYLVNGGRNDILVGVALLAATVLAMDGRERAAGVVAGLGAMIKLTGLVGIVALVVWLAARRGKSSAWRAASAAGGVLLVGYLLAGPAAAFTPMNTAGSMFSSGSVWQLLDGIAMPGTQLAIAVAAAIVLVVLVRARHGTASQAITASLTALTLCAPYTLPLYIAWALPTAALEPDSPVSRIAAAEGVVLIAGRALMTYPHSGPAGDALSTVASVGVPALSLVLLVMLVRAVKPAHRANRRANAKTLLLNLFAVK